jgi:hypothetical protein
VLPGHSSGSFATTTSGDQEVVGRIVGEGDKGGTPAAATTGETIFTSTAHGTTRRAPGATRSIAAASGGCATSRSNFDAIDLPGTDQQVGSQLPTLAR